MVMTLDRVSVGAAAIAEIDGELVRLTGQARDAADGCDREFARLRMDVLLERRYRISARRTNADEGVPTGSPAGGPE